MTTLEAPPSNPFLAALSDGAALTYLSMLNAGLAERFDPLPRAASGLGLVSSLLSSPLPNHGAELCAAMLALGLDATDEQELPHSHHNIAWHWTRNELGRESAPLASLAIASRSKCYEPLWQALRADQLRKIGSTALPLALLSENLDALGALLAAGVDPSAPDAAGIPPAARCKSPEAFQKMVDHGANLRATLPATYPYTGSDTLLDWILSKDGHAAAAKGMREIAVAWAEAHPPLGAPWTDLAASAFKALREDNKDSARRCVLAMGARAPEQLDESGERLALLAARHENYPELGRLLGLGADPFEVSPAGESPWSLVLANRFGKDQCHSWGHRAQSEKADRFLEHLSTKRKYKPIPWMRLNAQGIGLLESLIANAPMPQFLAHAQSAFALGLDPRAALSSGMDISCDMALRLARATPWVTNKRSYLPSPDEALVADFLSVHPIEKSSLGCKAAFARHFWDALMNTGSLSLRERGRTMETPLDGQNEPLLAVLAQGFRELGRQGALAPDFSKVEARIARIILPAARESILSAHQKGALDAIAAPGSAPRVGPMRM